MGVVPTKLFQQRIRLLRSKILLFGLKSRVSLLNSFKAMCPFITRSRNGVQLGKVLDS